MPNGPGGLPDDRTCNGSGSLFKQNADRERCAFDLSFGVVEVGLCGR